MRWAENGKATFSSDRLEFFPCFSFISIALNRSVSLRAEELSKPAIFKGERLLVGCYTPDVRVSLHLIFGDPSHFACFGHSEPPVLRLSVDVAGAGHGAAHDFRRGILILACFRMVDELDGLPLLDCVTVADDQTVILHTKELSVGRLHSDHTDAHL